KNNQHNSSHKRSMPLTLAVSGAGPQTPDMPIERRPGVHSTALVKRVVAHLFGAAVESAFVLVTEKLAMLFTPMTRDARALALGRGGRRHAAKSNAMHATRTPQGLCLFFMFGIFNVCCRSA